MTSRPRSSGWKRRFSSLHVLPVLQDLQDGGVGGGAADAQLLHPLHQARLRIARRRLGEVLVGRDLAALHRILLAHRRKGAGVLLLAGLAAGHEPGAPIGLAVVQILAVELEEAVEGDHRAGGAQPDAARRVGEVHRGLVQLRRLHLAGDGALPHQLVEAALPVVEEARDALRRVPHIGRADRLVRLLGVLGLGAVFARRGGEVVGAERLAHMAADGGDRLARHLHAIRPHVGDEADRFAARCPRPHRAAARCAWSAARRGRACAKPPAAGSRW